MAGILLLVGHGIRFASSFATVSPIGTHCSRPYCCSSLCLISPETATVGDTLLAATTTLGWISSDDATAAAVTAESDDTGLLSNQAIIATFVVGLVPFAVATVEFWRRIAVGDSFGTGSDSVVIIGEDDAPLSSRGRRVLGKGALVTAYILFGIAAAVLGIVLYAVISSSPDNVPLDLSSSS